MREKWDSLDKMIAASNREMEPTVSYNQVLMAKLKNQSVSKNEYNVVALSLITAGFLLFFTNTIDFQSNFTDVEYQVITGIILLKQGLIIW